MEHQVDLISDESTLAAPDTCTLINVLVLSESQGPSPIDASISGSNQSFDAAYSIFACPERREKTDREVMWEEVSHFMVWHKL